jgi:hypothetical protein
MANAPAHFTAAADVLDGCSGLPERLSGGGPRKKRPGPAVAAEPHPVELEAVLELGPR